MRCRSNATPAKPWAPPAIQPAKVRYGDNELADVNIYGHTPNMVDIDTRTVSQGRYFTDAENQRSAQVCLIGDSLAQNFFAGASPLGKSIRIEREEYTVIGTFEKIGSVLGQDQDNFVIVPMNQFFHLRPRFSLTLNVLTNRRGEELRARAG